MRNPVLIKYLREWDRSYIIFAPANIAEEQNPWAIMIIIPPSPPIGNSERKPMITKDMCTTDEYAITTLISLWARHKTPKRPPPSKIREKRTI